MMLRGESRGRSAMLQVRWLRPLDQTTPTVNVWPPGLDREDQARVMEKAGITLGAADVMYPPN